jgi:MFS family permease
MNLSSSAPPLQTDRPLLSFDLARVAVLLSLSVLINYIDRGTLSIAAPILKDDLRLSASQLGVLLSSFFWTYALFQIVSGWLVDRLTSIGSSPWVFSSGLRPRSPPVWSMASPCSYWRA